MMKYLMYLGFCIVTFFCNYKWITHIEKKERKFLKKWEKEYIEAYKDIWKKQYFLRLAEEKKLKEYEKTKKKESQEQREALKEVQIDDFDLFQEDYETNFQEAEIFLQKEEENK